MRIFCDARSINAIAQAGIDVQEIPVFVDDRVRGIRLFLSPQELKKLLETDVGKELLQQMVQEVSRLEQYRQAWRNRNVLVMRLFPHDLHELRRELEAIKQALRAQGIILPDTQTF